MPWHKWSPEERLAWAVPFAAEWRTKIKNWREYGYHSAEWIAREEAGLRELESTIAAEMRRAPTTETPAND